MTATYEKIATTTLGSSQASVTFSSISGSYTDLVLISDSTVASGSDGVRLRFNSDSGSNYSFTYMYGNGSSALSGRGTNSTSGDYNFIGTARSVNVCHIQNYSNSTTYKNYLSRGNGGDIVIAYVGLWRNTNAITNIEIIGASNLNTGSMFTLYGILKEA